MKPALKTFNKPKHINELPNGTSKEGIWSVKMQDGVQSVL